MSPLRTRQALSGRHPFEVFLLVLSVVTGAPGASGQAPPPSSIAAVTDPTAARLWSIGLVVGATVALVGVAWPKPRDRAKVSITGLSLEQVGLVGVAAVGTYYGVVVVLAVGAGALVAAGIIVAYAASCWVRAWQLQGIIRGTRAIAEHQ